MKEPAPNRSVVWVTAAIALVASIILIIDIAAHRRAELIDGANTTTTVAAAQAAGASVRPSGQSAEQARGLQRTNGQ